jgi:hypothetical protein
MSKEFKIQVNAKIMTRKNKIEYRKIRNPKMFLQILAGLIVMTALICNRSKKFLPSWLLHVFY